MGEREVLVLLLACTAAVVVLLGVLAWSRPVRRTTAVVLALGLVAAAGLALAACSTSGDELPLPATALVVLLTGTAALAGGGPLTAAVFALVDATPHGTPPRRDGVGSAGDVLRGGAWIGGLERVAVFASLVTGWPEGVALTLALKGLGRYPELRNEEHSGIAERFLIGTFVSVLWACAWAAVALSLVALT